MKMFLHKRKVSEITWFSQPVLGYRSWTIDHLGRLESIGKGKAVWTSGLNCAYCNGQEKSFKNSAPHHAPAAGCHCGFNAFHTLEEAQKYYSFALTVYGSVAMKGDLQVHSSGVRSGQAVVLGLLKPDVSTLPKDVQAEHMRRLNIACQRYDVPLLDALQLQEQSLTVACSLDNRNGFGRFVSAVKMHFSYSLTLFAIPTVPAAVIASLAFWISN